VEGNQLAYNNWMEIYNMEIHNMEIHNMEIHNMEIHNYMKNLQRGERILCSGICNIFVPTLPPQLVTFALKPNNCLQLVRCGLLAAAVQYVNYAVQANIFLKKNL
jgi:hypothetical protein